MTSMKELSMFSSKKETNDGLHVPRANANQHLRLIKGSNKYL